MARTKNKRGGHRGSLLNSAEKIGQVVAIAAPHVDSFILKRDTNLGVYRLSGYHMATGTWQWRGLVEGWGPALGFAVGAKVFHKLMGVLKNF